MGIGFSIIKKYYEYFQYNIPLHIQETELINPMEQLYQPVEGKICFGCREYQLVKPCTSNKKEAADLLYCQKCEIFYTGKQYAILSQNFQ